MSGPRGAFAKPAAWMATSQLAVVTDIQDPDGRARVKVQLVAPDPEDQATLWARVAVPFAGDNRGAFLIPDVGDLVLVLFAGGDVRAPIVVGALWNGKTAVPETVSGDRIDRWTITGKAGTRLAIVEESGRERVEIETPQGQKAVLTDEAGGSIELTQGGNTIKMSGAGIELQAAGKVSVTAAEIEASAGTVSVTAGMSTFSGVVKCDVLITNSVVSTAYTPGAGNIW